MKRYHCLEPVPVPVEVWVAVPVPVAVTLVLEFYVSHFLIRDWSFWVVKNISLQTNYTSKSPTTQSLFY